jgi:molybdopterin/thiamine biosynthesis adenylyltransferase
MRIIILIILILFICIYINKINDIQGTDLQGTDHYGVTAYINYKTDEKNYVNGQFTGLKWQCVEYARRWLIQVKGIIIEDVETAEDLWKLKTVTSINGKTYKFMNVTNGIPPVGSLLIYKKTNDMRSYHISSQKIKEQINFIPKKCDLYARSKGILETDVLEKKSVLIVGLGSFGSNIAVELAKSGIGKFVLVDMDFLELHNIARHQCGINDLGRFKTNAVRDLILQKNPFAKVETYEVSVVKNYQLLHTLMAKSDLVVCTTDNNTSRFAINQAAITLQRTVVFGRAITRAEGGDVFLMKPENKTCYACLINEDGTSKYSREEEISTSKQVDGMLPAYVSHEDKQKFIQVGLSSDIVPICNMIVKLSLTDLSKETPSTMDYLGRELTYNYYFWANRKTQYYLNYSAFNDANGKPTILKWYGAQIPANENCSCCN